MRNRGLQLPGYEGDKPFIYACFSGISKRRVYPFLRQLQERMFRVSFAGDATVGGAKAQRMAERIEKAELVLLFYSEKANAIPIWRYQVNYATDCKKRIVCVRLDDSEPSKGMRLQLADLTFYDAFSERERGAFFPTFAKMDGVTQSLIGDGVEGYPKDAKGRGLLRRTGFYVACAVALAAAVLAFVLPPRIRAMRDVAQTSPVAIEYLTVIRFSEQKIQDAVMQSLGKGDADTLFEDDLSSVTKLALCGSDILKDTDIVCYTVASGTQRIYVNGYGRLAKGSIEDIRELAMLRNLQSLTLSSQAVTDISALRGLNTLESLDISGNPITDLSPLSGLPALAALDISCVDAEDFSPLKELPKLTKLCIRNMPQALDTAASLPLTELDISGTEIRGALDTIAGITTLRSLNISETDVDSLDALTGMPNLETLNLRNCHNLTDLSALMRMPVLTRIYLSGSAALALSDDIFHALTARGVEIAL